ncbi:glutaminase liver isoform, mitochondrial [Acipenser ruthenus]|uniref:glutaminase liver isoform, mitochondrial n=1 Tax=Acipenser ruthenus TaxID=7906 RepID=UPI002741A5A5|nr:glutaminase liver isoform, mitochondrial [Acipenser ruthenus]
MENHQTSDPSEENPFLCFQRTPSLRRKWRKRYGGLDGNKLLEPNEEEDLPENGLMKDSHLERNSPQPRSAENQETLLVAKVGGLRTRTAPQGQKPVNLVTPGPTGASVFVNNRKQRSSSPHGEPLCHRNQFWNSITKVDSQQLHSKKKVAADVLFESFASEGGVNMANFFEAVWSSGIRKSDPRIKDCYLLMKKLQQADGTVDRNTFHRCVTGFVSFILKALQGRFVIPDFPTFTEETQKIFMKCKQLSSFKSELDSLENDSRKWGVSICTADGQRLSLGDCAEPCLLGECSWPLLYGIAVEQFSADYVHRYVGMEEFSKHDSSFTLTKQGIPHSPLVETGAIITSSLLQLAAGLGVEEEEKYESVLNLFRRLCNKGNVNLNCTRHQNLRKESIRLHALSFFLQEKKCFPESVDIGAALDLMLQGLSTEVTCESGAAMAATLANGGLCPLSDDQVLGPSSVRNTLSMMQVAGMNDYSRTFHFKTSIPAKSSKNGLVLAVVPGVMGIACWSPELDAFGNSWKGVHFCQELVSAFQLHSFDIKTPFRQVVTYRQWKAESEGYQIMNVLLAAYRGDVRSLRRYLLSGADVNSVDYDGRSALHVAASEGHLEVIKFLIENAGADHMATDRWGNTPLQESLRYKHSHAVQLLRRYKDHHESS